MTTLRPIPIFALLLCLIVFLPQHAFAMLPTLPQATVDTTLPTVTGSTFIVNAGGNLQAALNSAAAADPNLTHQIVLQAGATFQAPSNFGPGFSLPARARGTGWVIIRSSLEANLPAQGVRVAPSDAVNMPKIVAGADGSSAFTGANGSHRYRFIGLSIESHANTPVGESIAPGYRAIVDRCYIRGHPNGGSIRGVNANAPHVAVINSYIEEFKHTGRDTQAVWSFWSTGPILIRNNFLQAAGENVMIGGAAPPDAANVPHDITIQGNHFFKPLSWRTTTETPLYHSLWVTKNLLELKLGIRVLIEGNLFENMWASGQGGAAIVWTPRDETGTGAPWSQVSDVTFRYNIVRHAAGGINLLASDDVVGDISQQFQRAYIHDNLFWDIGGPNWDPQRIGASGRFLFIGSGYSFADLPDLVVDHNTVVNTGDIIYFNGYGHPGFVFQNTIVGGGPYGIGGGAPSSGFPVDILNASLVAPYVFTKNAIVADPYASPSRWPANNFFPTNYAAVGFVNPSGGDYRLATSSPYKNAGTDGKDLGADIDALEAAMVGNSTWRGAIPRRNQGDDSRGIQGDGSASRGGNAGRGVAGLGGRNFGAASFESTVPNGRLRNKSTPAGSGILPLDAGSPGHFLCNRAGRLRREASVILPSL